MKIQILDRQPEGLSNSQQALLDCLIEIASTSQPLTTSQLMDRLGLRVADALNTRFEHLQKKGVITGYEEPMVQAA